MRHVVFSLLAATAALLAFPAGGADVGVFGILKSQQFLQTNTGAPFLPVTNSFAFDAFVFDATNNSVASSTLAPPLGAPVQTLLPQLGQPNLLYEQRFDTQSAMDATFPSGSFFYNYNLTMNGTNDGQHTVALSFAANTYAITPQITSFTAAQSVDTTTSLTVTWTAPDGQANDLVQLLVQDAASNTIFATPFPSFPGALTGLSNSATIPPLALPPGANLTAHLSFGRPVGLNTNSYPGATGIAILGKDIRFPLITRPAPVPTRLTVTSAHLPPFKFQFLAETNRNYHVQSSSNLVNWTDLLVTNFPTVTNASFTDTNPAIPRRFYRLQIGP